MTGYSSQPISQRAAKELLALPLEDKALLSREKIEQWYSAWDGKCYVSFSGGKDSTVLAYLAAQELSRYRTPIYPLTLVFVNTGLEYERYHERDDCARARRLHQRGAPLLYDGGGGKRNQAQGEL